MEGARFPDNGHVQQVMETGHDADLYFPFAQICVGLSLASPLPDVAEFLDSAEDELTSEATRVGSEL